MSMNANPESTTAIIKHHVQTPSVALIANVTADLKVMVYHVTMSTNALLVQITVMIMQLAATHLDHLRANAMMGSKEMVWHAKILTSAKEVLPSATRTLCAVIRPEDSNAAAKQVLLVTEKNVRMSMSVLTDPMIVMKMPLAPIPLVDLAANVEPLPITSRTSTGMDDHAKTATNVKPRPIPAIVKLHAVTHLVDLNALVKVAFLVMGPNVSKWLPQLLQQLQPLLQPVNQVKPTTAIDKPNVLTKMMVRSHANVKVFLWEMVSLAVNQPLLRNQQPQLSLPHANLIIATNWQNVLTTTTIHSHVNVRLVLSVMASIVARNHQNKHQLKNQPLPQNRVHVNPAVPTTVTTKQHVLTMTTALSHVPAKVA
jgi:hypothetical protein